MVCAAEVCWSGVAYCGVSFSLKFVELVYNIVKPQNGICFLEQSLLVCQGSLDAGVMQLWNVLGVRWWPLPRPLWETWLGALPVLILIALP